ncbi:hypothetical protein BURC_02006 [Burkholderiaceae bacterium]|nr:hypothetical protein BURC_02006 [Burkholderiaceae bacterium]
MHPIRLILCAALCTALSTFTAAARAQAAEPGADADLDALSLADKPAEPQQAAKAWRAYVEGAGGREWWRGGGTTDLARASIDLRYDGTLAPGLRAVLSNRLDLVRSGNAPRKHNVNALREAYLSWQAQPDLIVDAGRVNIRHGAAWGFNPTDYFKGGALRSVVSPDPAALRENRLGTVVLQGQKLWSRSALSAAWSPRLERRPSDETWSLDLGSTNPRHRWLLAGSHKFGERLNPQLLLHGGEDTPTQLGLNVSGLLNDATVGYLEFSAGKGRSLRSQALGWEEDESSQQRAAVGLTVTTGFNLSLTAEAQYSSAAPNRAEWEALTAVERLQFLGAAQRLQELPVRRAAFFYATWKDAFVRRHDLSAFVRHDPVTRSRAQWIETRYHWDRIDLALQYQLFSGRAGSVFGSVPQHRVLELSLRMFL